MRFKDITLIERAAIDALIHTNPQTKESEKDAVIRAMRIEAKAVAKLARQATTAANRKAREERAARALAASIRAAEMRAAKKAAREAKKVNPTAIDWHDVPRRPVMTQKMADALEAYNLDAADWDGGLTGLSTRDVVSREPSVEESEEPESIVYLNSKWNEDREDFDYEMITVEVEPDMDPWQGFDGGEIAMRGEEEEADLELDRQERMAELYLEWDKCEYVRTEKKVAAPVPRPFERFIPATQDFRDCCRYGRKQHFHYECSDCGNMAPAKSKLDTANPIFCAACHAARKAAGYYDKKVDEAVVECAPAAASEATDAPPVAELAPAPEPEIHNEPAPDTVATTEEVHARPEDRELTIFDRIETVGQLVDVIAALESNGFRFGVNKPQTVAKLEERIAASPSWAARSPSPVEVIELALTPPAPIPEAADEATPEPEPVVEATVAEMIVEAPEPVVELGQIRWEKLTTGRKVRQVVALLEELQIVDFGLIKPTTAKDLKVALKQKLGAEWMAMASIPAKRFTPILEN